MPADPRPDPRPQPRGAALRADARLNLSATVASVTVALVLSIAKLWAFALTGSLSVAAALADSGLDLMMSLAGLAAVLYAARPADDDHTFGHTSVEDLAALAQSLFILVAAGVIGVAAVRRLWRPEEASVAAADAGVAVMVLSIVLTFGLVLWQGRVARRTGSRVVAADRLHYLGDLVPNVGAIVALVAASRFGLHQIDAVIALAAAAMLGVGALRIGAGAWDALMDRAADAATVEGIAALARDWPGVHGFHDLQTRQAGSRIFVNLHVELDGDLPLRDAHDIGAGLRAAIRAKYPRCEVIIHKDVAGRRHGD